MLARRLGPDFDHFGVGAFQVADGGAHNEAHRDAIVVTPCGLARQLHGVIDLFQSPAIHGGKHCPHR